MKYRHSDILVTLELEEYELHQIIDAVITKCNEDKSFTYLLSELLKVAKSGTTNINSSFTNYWKEANEKCNELVDGIYFYSN